MTFKFSMIGHIFIPIYHILFYLLTYLNGFELGLFNYTHKISIIRSILIYLYFKNFFIKHSDLKFKSSNIDQIT